MKNLEGKNAILYRRVSTTDQKDFGNSLNDQKSCLRGFCSKHLIYIGKEFEEDFSAKNFIRPAFTELFKYVTTNKKKIDLLLVQKWDRYARNALEALQFIETFKQMGIEVNAIDQWIDHDDASQLMMLLIYLGMPEVDNKIRSEKVIAGNRRALKEGRWVHTQPKGYIPGKDVLGKTLMKPDLELAPLISKLFNDFALGVYSQNQLLKMPKYKNLHLSKSNLSRIFKQIAYAGKIRVPEYKDEQEEVVEALHQPLISIDTFNKVQLQLNHRSRYKQKASKLNEYLPLRGHLKCSQCGSNLTGSASTSKTGAKHYYYHCNPKKGCGERFKINSAHSALTIYLKGLKPYEEVCDLLELILKDNFENSEASKKNLLKKKQIEINNLSQKKNILVDRLLDGTIDNSTYKGTEEEIKTRMSILEVEKSDLKEHQKDTMEFVNFGIYLFKNINSFFEKANVSIKQKILSSILSEKLVFNGEEYRTPKLSKGFEFIYESIKKLNSIKRKNERQSYDYLPFCTQSGT